MLRLKDDRNCKSSLASSTVRPCVIAAGTCAQVAVHHPSSAEYDKIAVYRFMK
jgi:hypothetical protein